MIINTIEVQKDGSFLVNKNIDVNDDGQISVPDDMENRHRIMIQEWIDAGNTPTPFVGSTDMELWKEKMATSDSSMPRHLEDHIKDDHDGVAGNEFLQAKYDEKKTLRATRP